MQKGLLKSPKLLLPVAIIAATTLIVIALFTSTSEISFKQPQKKSPAVETISLQGESISIPIHNRGFIESELPMLLSSQVVGQVIKVSPNFENGADFKKGDLLLEIDNSLLRLEYSQAKAALKQANVKELELDARVRANRDITKKSSALAQGRPQLEAAKARTEAAKAQLRFNEKQLSHAKITADFDGRIEKRFTHLYDQLQPGKPIARIYSTESFILKISLTRKQLSLLSQDIDQDITNNKITLQLSQPDRENTFQATAQRLEKQLNKAQQITLIAKLDPKFNRDVLPGALFDIELKGQQTENIIKIPSSALRHKNTLWLIKDDLLNIANATVIYRGKNYVYIENSFEPNTRLIISNLSQVANDMPVIDLGETRQKDE